MRPVSAVVIAAACGSSPAPDRCVEMPGLFAVGTDATTLTDAARSRTAVDTAQLGVMAHR